MEQCERQEYKNKKLNNPLYKYPIYLLKYIVAKEMK